MALRSLQIVESLIANVSCRQSSSISSGATTVSRIVRFLASKHDDAKSGYDDSTSYYGVLQADQNASVGTSVSVFDFDNIYDPATYKMRAFQKRIGKLLPPIDVVNIYCVGLNYKFHAKESQMALPKYPVIFSKPTSSIIAGDEDIVIPKCAIKASDTSEAGEVDYEVELVIVIGKRCKNVSESDALQYIFGYSVANDVSARDWQINKEKSGTQWLRGKSFDTFCPFGPCILLQNDAVDAQDMNLYCTVNGKRLQNANTQEMIFGIAKLVSFISQSTTLLPGTIILTGTPDGVGFARKPPIWLKHDDIVTVGVEGIGELVNHVKDE